MAISSRVPVTPAVVDKIWLRDVGDFFRGSCFSCGSALTARRFECGHVVSHAHGGEATFDNLRVVCGPCNRAMGTANMYMWMVLQNSPTKNRAIGELTAAEEEFVTRVHNAVDVIKSFHTRGFLRQDACNELCVPLRVKQRLDTERIQTAITAIDAINKAFEIVASAIRMSSDIGQRRDNNGLAKENEAEQEQFVNTCKALGMPVRWSSLLGKVRTNLGRRDGDRDIIIALRGLNASVKSISASMGVLQGL